MPVRSHRSKHRAFLVGTWLFSMGAGSPALALEFSPEIVIGERAPIENVLHYAGIDAVFDGEHFVTMFSSDRFDLQHFQGQTFLARVDREGQVLDPHGIAVFGAQRIAAAPWGTLVVFSHREGIFARRLGRDGQWLDAQPVTLAESEHDSTVSFFDSTSYGNVFSACTQHSCWVTWGSSERLARSVDDCGRPVGATFELPVDTSALVAGDDGYFLARSVVGQDPEFIVEKRAVDGQLFWTSGALPLPPTAQSSAVVVRAQDELVLFWPSTDPETGETAGMLRLDDDGQVIEDPQWIATSGRVHDAKWDEDGFRLVSHGAEGVSLLRVSREGELLDSTLLELPVAEGCSVSSPLLTLGPTETLLSWYGSANNARCEATAETTALLGDQRDAPGASVEAFRLMGADARMGPAHVLAHDGQYLVSWSEERREASGAYAQWFDSEGRALDSSRLLVPFPARLSQSRPTRSAWVGGHLALWAGSVKTRFDAWDDPAQLALSDPQTGEWGQTLMDRSVGTAGSETFLLHDLAESWGEDAPTSSHLRIRIADAAGRPQSETPSWENPLSSLQANDLNDSDPVSAFDGEHYGLVWRQSSSRLGPPSGRIEGGLGEWITEYTLLFNGFDETGASLSELPVTLSGLESFIPLAMVFGGDAYLLILERIAEDDTIFLYATRLGRSGDVLDEEPVLLRKLSVEPPSSSPVVRATFDGSRYLVAFEDASAPQDEVFMLPSTDIYVATLEAQGGLPSVELVAGGPQDEQVGALASVQDGRALLTYRRFEPASGIVRAYAKLLGDGGCRELDACGVECASECCAMGCPDTVTEQDCTATPIESPSSGICASEADACPDPSDEVVGCACRIGGPSGKNNSWFLLVPFAWALRPSPRRSSRTFARRSAERRR